MRRPQVTGQFDQPSPPSPTIVSGLGNGLLSAMRPRRAAAVTHTKAVTQPVRLRVLRPAAYPTVHPPPQSTIRLPQPLSWQTQAVPIGHIDPNTSPRGLTSALSRRAPPMRDAIAKCQLRSPPKMATERLMPCQRPHPSGSSRWKGCGRIIAHLSGSLGQAIDQVGLSSIC